MFIFTTLICAREKSLSLLVGVDPCLGNLSTKIKMGDEKHKINYNAGFGVLFDIEKQLNGAVSLSEFRYGKWKCDECKPYDGTSLFPIPATCDDVNSFSFMQYGGKTIFPKKRVQIPLYIGIGLDYLRGAPYHNLFFDFGAKARIKFYITSKFGLFAGADYTFGYGSSSRDLPEKSSKSFNLYTRKLNVDFGFTVNI